ncbi:hypothetical protein BC629DRAFT_1594287 [Irpex lacteus]|nr:hypothetical protein BC629DRAFT_1594287 [Irpex lacteus]
MSNATAFNPAPSHVTLTPTPSLQVQLVTAIRNLPADQLREHLTRAIWRDRAVADVLEKVLLPDGVKVKKMAKCWRCYEGFDVEAERVVGECHLHNGELEVNPDAYVWTDWDEYNDYYGPMNTKRNRREFPEGFAWDCCGGDANSEGCEKEIHEVKPTPAGLGASQLY